ncbi:ABC transporter ATP-binding protein [Chlorobium phaeovibrioides]|uniref:ATP-binding cassette domain-containing protein n=2 Tax=Chlorobium phaeovibrioides TaxID=1094 RepID=A0ABW9US61_CHLPH|nr:ABC transporter ATP-binding protein [Chlorobium phaeovibrioides]MWV53686.1 ATP-binding cassette domain-containing protein [Chlorobium phaeovibrioides]QEQ56515.1 ABC transporter ATP-binding protein [Chlorobium phaeovibrioides]HCD36006.1 ABC transporter ATP-binding protein [Chlorobium sp.]
MAEEILRLDHIRKELELSRDVRQTIIPNLSLEINAGEFVSITGPSGSGKSTLLYIMGGLDKPTSGRVWLSGEDITEKNETEMTRIRNSNIGFIYQFHFLLPEFNALENVSMPMMISGGFSRKEIRERAMELLAMVELTEKHANRPSQLSGGQQQRVAIARALANNPKVLLGDEPTGNLDSRSADNVYQLFDRLNRELSQTVVVVTHDEDFANRAGRRIHLVDGKIESDRTLSGRRTF